jgi:hypothetical protein
MPPSSTTRRWLLSLRAFGKYSSKGRGRTSNPVPRGFATGVVSPIIFFAKCPYTSDNDRDDDKKGKKKMEKKR